METLSEIIIKAIEKYHVKFMKKKVLKTVEEVEANTDAADKYIAGAGVADELINKLMFPDGTEFYLDAKGGIRGYNTSATRGADTFCPFSNFTGRRIWNNFWGAESEGNYPVRWPVPDGVNMITLVTAIGIYSGGHYCSLSGAGIISKKDILSIVGTGMDTARLQIWEICTKPGDDIVITLHITGYPIARVSCAIFY